jgi:quinol monooxygenase YgiN
MSWRDALIGLVVIVMSPLMSTGVLRAQAPAGTEVYAVAYVDVLPSARATMVAAIKQYREASSRASNDGRIDAFEQNGRPGHYVVIERWKDQAALDIHAATAHAKAFRTAMQPVRVSGYDERPYKPLATGAGAWSGAGTVFVISHVDIGGGAQAQAPAILSKLAEASRQEPGSLRFDVLVHAMRANHFTVFEAWRDQSALDAHVAAPHTKSYRDVLQPISGSPVDERVFTAVQ